MAEYFTARKVPPLAFFAYCFLVLTVACAPHGAEQKNEADSTSKADAATSPDDKIPAFRKEVKRRSVASYSVRTDNPLNEWYFRVQLFETSRTFHYLMKLQFEAVEGADTLKLPNFGTLPQPDIRKGPEKYSCIVGFYDKDRQFREYKKIYVTGNKLKVTALKHYAVYRYQREAQ